MPPQVSSGNAELEVAVDRLATKFARVKLARSLLVEKQAFGEGFMDAAKGYFDKAKGFVGNASQGELGLAGAGLGAVGGGLLGAGAGMLGPRDATGKKRTLRSALSGALAGAGVGGGLGLLGGYARDAMPASTPGGGGPGGGQPQESGPVMSYIKKHPVLSMIGAADATNQAVGTMGELARRGSSVNPSHLSAGIDRILAAPGKFSPEQLAEWKTLSQANPEKLRDILHAAQANRGVTGMATGTQHLTWDNILDATRQGSGPIRGGNVQDLLNIRDAVRNKFVNPNAYQNPVQSMMGSPVMPPPQAPWTGSGTGHVPHPSGVGVTPQLHPKTPGATFGQRAGEFTRDLGPKAKRLLANQPGSAVAATTKGTLLKKLGPRALLYAGLPLLQSYGEDIANKGPDNSNLFSFLGGN